MVTAVAKHCGDFVNKGLYDIHIDLMGVPMMEEKSPIKDNFVTAKHIMSRYDIINAYDTKHELLFINRVTLSK